MCLSQVPLHAPFDLARLADGNDFDNKELQLPFWFWIHLVTVDYLVSANQLT